MRFLAEENFLGTQSDEIHQLLNEVARTNSPNHIRELFYTLPVYLFSDTAVETGLDAKPVFLGNERTPKDIIHLIENIDQYL